MNEPAFAILENELFQNVYIGPSLEVIISKFSQSNLKQLDLSWYTIFQKIFKNEYDPYRIMAVAGVLYKYFNNPNEAQLLYVSLKGEKNFKENY